MSVTGTIRLVVGAALVAAGGTLVGPLAVRLAEAARAPVGGAVGGVPWAGPAPTAPFTPPAAVPAGQPSSAGALPPEDPWAALPTPSGPDSAGGLQLDRHPPLPPAPLPPAPAEMAQTTPPLGAAYRSTLRVPPPDLLDAEAPPPAVAWAASTVAPAAVGHGSSPPTAIPLDDVAVPRVYRIRDGDDLAGIAGRFYGHPSAASAIWAANRDTIQHPDLLPIGAELRLPPRWAAAGHPPSGAGAIEPAAYSRPTAPAPASPVAAPGTTTWLAPVPESSGAPSPVPPTATQPIATQPMPTISSVHSWPGETLGALARRVYGDPAMAEQIFAVNRDRLRSPDLLVAGTELRLPRPVTAPRP